MAESESKTAGSLTIPALLITILAFFGLVQRPGGKEASSPPTTPSNESGGGGKAARTSPDFSLSRMLGETSPDSTLATDARMVAQLEVLQRYYFPRIAADQKLVRRFNPPKKSSTPKQERDGQTGEPPNEPANSSDLLTWLLQGGSDDAKQGDEISCLIALVPDPVRSGSPYSYDLALQALTLSLRSAGYLLEIHDVDHLRSHRDKAEADKADSSHGEGKLPENKGSDPDTRPPGVILLRQTSSNGGREQLLLLLLVTETPVRGVNAAMLHSAFALGERNLQLQGQDGPIRVIGPYFTGTAPSVIQAVRDWQSQGEKTPQLWIDGSASAINLPQMQREIDSGQEKSSFQIKTMLASSSDVNAELLKYVDNHLRPVSDRGPLDVAYLTEESTGFGARSVGAHLSRTQPRIRFVNYTFPLHISEVRRLYSKQAAGASDDSSSIRVGEQQVQLKPNELLGFSDEGSKTPDLPPLASPEMMAAYDELRLRQTADDINRRNLRFVFVSATDVRDTVFVLRYIREHCPDVQLLTSTNDVALTHHENYVSLRGTLVASSFPLWTSQQTVSVGTLTDQGVISLPDDSAHGLYNACLAHLIERHCQRNPGLLPGSAEANQLELLVNSMVGYSPESPFMVGLSVVGQKQFQPLAPPSAVHPLPWFVPIIGGNPRSYAMFKWRLPRFGAGKPIAGRSKPVATPERIWSWTSGVTPAFPLECMLVALAAWLACEWRTHRVIGAVGRGFWPLTRSAPPAAGPIDAAVEPVHRAYKGLFGSWFFKPARPLPREEIRWWLRMLGVAILIWLVPVIMVMIHTWRWGHVHIGRFSHHAVRYFGPPLCTFLAIAALCAAAMTLCGGVGPGLDWLVAPHFLSILGIFLALSISCRLVMRVPWFHILASALAVLLMGFVLLRTSGFEPAGWVHWALRLGLLMLFTTLLHEVAVVCTVWQRFSALTASLLNLPLGSVFDRLPKRLTAQFASPLRTVGLGAADELTARFGQIRAWLLQGRHGGDPATAWRDLQSRVEAEWSARDPRVAYSDVTPETGGRPEIVNPRNRSLADRVLAAEEYFALECVRTLNQVLSVIWNRLALVTVLGLLLMAAVNSYPFTPGGQLFRWMMIVVILAVAAIVFVVAGIHRNELIARVNKQPVDRSFLSLDFASKMATYAVPLVALLAAFSYGFGDLLAVVLGPFLKG
jgi:hypothetical protein